MRRLSLIGLLLTAVFLSLPGETAVPAHARPGRQDPTPMPAVPTTEPIDRAAQAQALWAAMTPEQRVGQLFLVTFSGDQVTPNSAIADLILNYHVGGVVLERQNDNITGFNDPAQTPAQVASLTHSLQQIALFGTIVITNTAVADENPISGLPLTPTPQPRTTATPLFIGINHEGDGYPYTHIMHGLTDLPSQMAIGATWQPDNARLVGDVVGQELSALGINMVLGPVLDVVQNPNPAHDNQLGVRVFSGDPYWVGLMGQAYTQGVHDGSRGRVAVIAKHFPGFGDSDRPLHGEIPTVQKQLNQLQQVELVPFFAVTGGAPSNGERVDGLLTTHIRYQGFQGNVQATTNPVSLDAQAIASLMSLPAFSSWRTGGGVIVSDKLGVRAIERFYDDQQQGFPHRVIAKDAFLAGNDLLYLGEFALGEAAFDEQVRNTQDTIRWFQERYQTDAAFQQQVDTAVLRILQLKLRLYSDDFSPDNILGDLGLLATALRQPQEPGFAIAQGAITLLYPSAEVLAERIARPPGPGESIIIFTDERQVQQCSFCTPRPLIDPTAIETHILASYGPASTGQVQPDQISSYTFADLADFLEAGTDPIIYNGVPVTPTIPPGVTAVPEAGAPPPFPTATPPPAYLVQESLLTADWIIFALLDNGASAQTVNRFLAQRPDLLRNTQVIVFAYQAPYYLDTTEVTQLTAYYGVYSKIDTFVNTSVRALFQELPLQGAAPVNVQAINYTLFDQTQPTPDQIIPLRYVTEGETIESSQNPNPLAVSVGDTLQLMTGIILDYNGNPVPDDTIVRFIERDRIQGSLNIIAEVPTVNGVARLDYVLQARTEGGQFRIGVEAGKAIISQELDISVSDSAEGVAQVEIINPTAAPTETPSPTPDPTPTATFTAVPSQPPTNTPTVTITEPEEPGVRIELSEFWMLTAVSLSLMMVAGIGLIGGNRRHWQPAQRLGWPLWGMTGGLLCYVYFALELPGTAVLAEWEVAGGLFITLLGGLLGLIAFHLRQSMK